MKILLIEDERKAALELKRLIQNVRTDAVILDVLQSIEESIEWLKNNPAPDLIFSDIQLADGLSFDIYNAVKIKSPIIFCTAFDEYAIRAFETNSIDYLLKPVDKSKLEQSIMKYEEFKKIFSSENDEYARKLHDVFAQLKRTHKSTLLVHYQEKIIPIAISTIDFFYYEHGIVFAYVQQHRYQLSNTLDELELVLDAREFFRANRQFIVQRKAVVNVEHYFARKLFIKLNIKTPDNIIVSKAKATAFIEWLAQ
jgi:two-component system, LytTR family, response regulator LytT